MGNDDDDTWGKYQNREPTVHDVDSFEFLSILFCDHILNSVRDLAE